ncbi:hypothetical protein GT755_38100 [Herbidospora sp. NEAU-GS84]|uniref:Uncharacterized protein n=1 Tax=Herbidospora solisilvae TaxID=2696284 RepID=A0A7C9J8I2_9ACTN|nr:hypothetical protein [Herbidospora solisilvae]NAS27467.1 hypothetical protein [Herbidospora solisilvae]
MSEWTGDKLDSPERVSAFATQLRRVLSDQADWVASIRREAEAMWKNNPPEEFSTFEAWWRHRWVTSPFGEIQEHLEEAAKLTFALEARYRRGRHEIPARRQAAAEARQAARSGRMAPQLGRDSQSPGRAGHQPARPGPARSPQDAPVNFMDLIRNDQNSHNGRRRPA